MKVAKTADPNYDSPRIRFSVIIFKNILMQLQCFLIWY